MKAIKKRSSRSRLKKRADDLFSLLIRKRDKRCLKCGSRTNLQCSHLIRRTNLAHRWDEKAAFTLCYSCHLHWWHKEPLEANMWLSENYPDMNLYYWEHKDDLVTEQPDYEAVIKRLKKELDRLS